MKCIAVAVVLLASARGYAEPAIPRLAVELELFTDAAWVRRDGPDLTQFRLDRGEVGATVGLGPQAGSELRLESLRSAAEGGALGIGGDSIVVRVKRAQVFGHVELGDVRLDGAAGITADPWLAEVENGYTLRPLSATGSERLLGWPTSDLAAVARASYGPVRLDVSFGNGEGLRYPERNNGKTTTAVFEVRPFVTREVRVAVMGRDGSIGPALVRERRVGASAMFGSDEGRVGLEVVRAWGIGDRGDLVGTVLAGWGEVQPIDHLFVAARGATIGFDAGGRSTTVGGAVAVEPWHDHAARLRVWLAIDHTSSSGAAMPLPGADPGTATTVMLIASTTAPFTVD